MSVKIKVDPNGTFTAVLKKYSNALLPRVQWALETGANRIADRSRGNMASNGNIDRGYLFESIGILETKHSDTEMSVTVGPSRDPYPGRDGKSFNDIGAFLERGTSNGGVPWTWKGPDDSPAWAGWHVGWRGSWAHPFLIPAFKKESRGLRALIKDAAGRWV